MADRTSALTPAFLINDLRAGGAERLVKDLAIEMQGYEGVEPIVIVANPIGELVSDLEESDVEVVSLGTSVSTTTIPRATWRLSRVLRDARDRSGPLPPAVLARRRPTRLCSPKHSARFDLSQRGESQDATETACRTGDG